MERCALVHLPHRHPSPHGCGLWGAGVKGKGTPAVARVHREGTGDFRAAAPTETQRPSSSRMQERDLTSSERGGAWGPQRLSRARPLQTMDTLGHHRCGVIRQAWTAPQIPRFSKRVPQGSLAGSCLRARGGVVWGPLHHGPVTLCQSGGSERHWQMAALASGHWADVSSLSK